jgi:hypothetical protein
VRAHALGQRAERGDDPGLGLTGGGHESVEGGEGEVHGAGGGVLEEFVGDEGEAGAATVRPVRGGDGTNTGVWYAGTPGFGAGVGAGLGAGAGAGDGSTT